MCTKSRRSSSSTKMPPGMCIYRMKPEICSLLLEENTSLYMLSVQGIKYLAVEAAIALLISAVNGGMHKGHVKAPYQCFSLAYIFFFLFFVFFANYYSIFQGSLKVKPWSNSILFDSPSPALNPRPNVLANYVILYQYYRDPLCGEQWGQRSRCENAPIY